MYTCLLRVLPQWFFNSVWSRDSVNISTLDLLFSTLLFAALSLCVLLILTYHSLSLTWELFQASRWSPSLLDLPAEVFLTSPNPDVLSTLLPACSDKPLAPCNTEDEPVATINEVKPTATEDKPSTALKEQRPKPKPKGPSVRKSDRNAGKTKSSKS